MAKRPKHKSAPKAKPRAKKPGDRRGTPKGKATGVGKGRGGGGKIGNPPFEPTEDHRRIVLTGAAFGTPYPIIADEIGICEDTLRKYFRRELDEGLPRANARLGGVLYKKAEAGDQKAIDSWFDRRGGSEWKKKSALEHSGPDGSPIEYSDLSEEELDARIAARLADRASKPKR